MSFIEELKRRNVFRVAVLYVVVGWLILQVTDVFTSLLPLPDWSSRLVVLLVLLGFPIALILAWAFELTPEGLRRDREVGPSSTGATVRRPKIDYFIGGALVLALTYTLWTNNRGDAPEAVGHGDIRSIAVLPLENLVNDPDQAFFVAGMHEALITELSRIEELRVISRTSAMSFKGSNKPVPQIARELGVDAIIEGSVLKAGDVVRVTVQLIDAETDQPIWADNFDHELSDILALYGEVTREIVRQVEVTLSSDEEAAILSAQPVDPVVYEYYLKGRFLCDIWSPQEMARGVELLQKAVSLDPGNAPAHAQLAVCLQYSAFFGYVPTLDILDRSRAAALQAVRLDDRLAEAHVALAGVEYYLEYRPQAAQQSLETALALDPSNVRGLVHASWLLGESGRFEEAFEFNQQALRIDPLSTLVYQAMGQLHYLSRDYPAALETFSKALELDRGDASLHYTLAWPLEETGELERAISHHEKAIELSQGSTLYRASLGHTLARAGRETQARQILDELLQAEAPPPHDIALIHIGLGEHEKAMDWLERAYEARDSQLIYINRGPRFDPLRDHPRFKALLAKIDWPDPDSPMPATE